MFGVRTALKQVYYTSWFTTFRRLHRGQSFGRGIVFYGIPIFRIGKRATVAIGNNVVFTSDPKVNMVGLSKKCSFFVADGASLTIGQNSGFSGVSIYCTRKVSIGDFVTCGGNVSIWDTDFHPSNWRERRENLRGVIASAPVHIGNDVFIGANCIILKGVTIGDRSVLGAGSVVAGVIPAGEIWAGNPARFIRSL